MKKGWQTKTLGDVLVKTETTDPTRSPSTEFDYIDVSSVSNETLTIQETQRLKGKDAPSRARRLVRVNDVLFATIRPTLRRIAIVPEELDEQVCSTGYFVLRPKPEVDFRFVFYFLQTEDYMAAMEKLQKGASYPAVTDGDVRSQPIPVPPLAEQQRIVGVLDEAFAGLATAQAHAAQNLQNARALFESHLQSVFTRRGDGWVERELGDLCEFENGDRGTNYPNKSARTASGIPFINAGHLTESGLDMETMDFISKERFDLLGAGKVRPKDILFCLRGSLGKYASVGDLVAGAIASSLVIVRPRPTILDRFVLAYFGSPICAEMINRFKNGAAQPNLSANSLKKFVIPVPPLAEQESIADELDALAAETQRLTRLYEQKQAALAALKKSLLHQAFTGEL